MTSPFGIAFAPNDGAANLVGATTHLVDPHAPVVSNSGGGDQAYETLKRGLAPVFAFIQLPFRGEDDATQTDIFRAHVDSQPNAEFRAINPINYVAVTRGQLSWCIAGGYNHHNRDSYNVAETLEPFAPSPEIMRDPTRITAFALYVVACLATGTDQIMAKPFSIEAGSAQKISVDKLRRNNRSLSALMRAQQLADELAGAK